MNGGHEHRWAHVAVDFVRPAPDQEPPVRSLILQAAVNHCPWVTSVRAGLPTAVLGD